MAIVNDTENKRVVDTEAGQYLTWKTADRENFTTYFTIYDDTGMGLLGSEVKRRSIDEKNVGAATLVKFELLNTWIPSGRPEPPTYFYGDHELIGKLEEFLRVKMHYGGVKDPDPEFEFVDERRRAAPANRSAA